jgi:DNA-damage-inducible protein J
MSNTTTANINIKVDKALKENVEEIFDAIGVSMTTALVMYLKQVQRKRAIPFELAAPTPWEETLEAIEESRRILSGEVEAKRYSTAEHLHREILGDYK